MDSDGNAPVTKAELKAELAEVVKQLKEYIDERTFDAETRLLRGFEKHWTDYKLADAKARG
jgi:hypothetical protein